MSACLVINGYNSYLYYTTSEQSNHSTCNIDWRTMVQSVFLAGLLASLALSQAVLLSKKLPDSAGLLRPVKIKVQPKELIDDCLDCQPTPSAKDLNVAILTKLIGGKMNSDIYSITKPTDFDNPKVFKYLSNRHEKARKKYLENFVAHHTKIMGNNGQMTINQKAFLVSWLEEQSSCPLRMEWKDMGPYSWPRYIKVSCWYSRVFRA